MNKEKFYLGIIIVLILTNVFVIGMSYFMIDLSNADGWKSGVKTTIYFIMDEVERDGFIVLYNPDTQQEMTLLDFNYSMDICLNATEEALFSND